MIKTSVEFTLAIFLITYEVWASTPLPVESSAKETPEYKEMLSYQNFFCAQNPPRLARNFEITCRNKWTLDCERYMPTECKKDLNSWNSRSNVITPLIKDCRKNPRTIQTLGGRIDLPNSQCNFLEIRNQQLEGFREGFLDSKYCNEKKSKEFKLNKQSAHNSKRCKIGDKGLLNEQNCQLSQEEKFNQEKSDAYQNAYMKAFEAFTPHCQNRSAQNPNAEDSLDVRIIKNYQLKHCQWKDESSAPECKKEAQNWFDLKETIQTKIKACENKRPPEKMNEEQKEYDKCVDTFTTRLHLFESFREGFIDGNNSKDCEGDTNRGSKNKLNNNLIARHGQQQEVANSTEKPCTKMPEGMGRDLTDFDDCRKKEDPYAQIKEKAYLEGKKAGGQCPKESTSSSAQSQKKSRGRGRAAR